MNCPRCGKENDNTNMVCSNCLKEIASESFLEAKRENEQKKYDDNHSNLKTNIVCLSSLGIVAIIIVVICALILKSCINSMPSSTYYPKDWKDMTNKQYKDFKKWDNKQLQKKQEEKKAFGN